MEKTNIDLQLIKEAKEGKQEAFSKLFNNYYGLVFTTAFKILKNYADAQDLTMITFEKAFSNKVMKKYEPITSYASWLIKIATNKSIDFLKEKKYQYKPKCFVEIESVNDIIYYAQNIEEKIIDKEKWKETKKIIKKLPPVFKEILILRFKQELKCKEIANELNISINTVIGRIRYLRKNMRRELKNRNVL